jgi:hypothetical protein
MPHSVISKVQLWVARAVAGVGGGKHTRYLQYCMSGQGIEFAYLRIRRLRTLPVLAKFLTKDKKTHVGLPG